MNDLKWSKTEKAIARRAFYAAYEREWRALAARLKEKADNIRESDDIWRVDDFLEEQLKEIRYKYDYRCSVLIMVFARLMNEGWLSEADLEGLGEDKIERIKYIVGL